jgi:hypothetical protein
MDADEIVAEEVQRLKLGCSGDFGFLAMMENMGARCERALSEKQPTLVKLATTAISTRLQ